MSVVLCLPAHLRVSRSVPWPAPHGNASPDVLAPGVFAGSPEHEVYDGLVEAAAWGGQVPEGFDGELGPVLL